MLDPDYSILKLLVSLIAIHVSEEPKMKTIIYFKLIVESYDKIFRHKL